MMLSWYTPSKALLSGLSLDLCREFPSVTALNLGGGYKVRRCKLNPIREYFVPAVDTRICVQGYCLVKQQMFKYSSLQLRQYDAVQFVGCSPCAAPIFLLEQLEPCS